MTSRYSWTAQIENLSIIVKSSIGKYWSRESRAIVSKVLCLPCLWRECCKLGVLDPSVPFSKSRSGVFCFVSWTSSYNTVWRKCLDTTHLEKWIDCLSLNTVTLKKTSKSYFEAVSFTFYTSDLNLECDFKSGAKLFSESRSLTRICVKR